jgi:hypothetical protein
MSKGATMKALRRRYGHSREDHTQEALADLIGLIGHWDASSLGIRKAASGALPKKLTASHEAAMRRVGAGLFLGPWSRALAYAPAVAHWPKAEHRALVQLVKRGDLRVMRVSGDDLAPWKAGVSASVHANDDFGYVIVPAGVT